ncbi:hypothetical protein DL240_15700 [Lujinxingia litoralis]|uniref:DUF819 domain-containing protein n=1 Tax=Lujinxingia litoralis TaxID=2211119 RepID=A0A328C2D0_9DELT|nr:DUF819 family protein [Lujinxingia litoralis]RAL20760.1 hypothetical protein DL240_15700 [Lujinxingia litoralis]
MIGALVLVIVALGMPVLARWLEARWRAFEVFHPVLLCYGSGIVLAHVPGLEVAEAVAQGISEAAIPLAIPLLLFSSDVRGWLKQGRAALVSFGSAVVSVLVVVGGLSGWLAGWSQESAGVAGMMVGVYTGGTPNMLSVGKALGVSQEVFVAMNAADVVVGGMYLLFVVSVGGALVRRVFPAYVRGRRREGEAVGGEGVREVVAGEVARGVGLAVGVVALSVGGALMVSGELSVALVMLGITSGGIAGSLSSRVRAWRGTYEAGEYLILVFCVGIGAMTRPGELMGVGLEVVGAMAAVMLGSVALHALLARVLRVDGDTFLITSTAAIYGPPFVPMVAERLGNRELILPGVAMGLLGFALGNYLGVGMAWWLMLRGG